MPVQHRSQHRASSRIKPFLSAAYDNVHMALTVVLTAAQKVSFCPKSEVKNKFRHLFALSGQHCLCGTSCVQHRFLDVGQEDARAFLPCHRQREGAAVFGRTFQRL